MKYASLKKTASKEYKIEQLNGGLDIKTNSRFIDDSQLCECKNMWFENGILKTRPGINSQEGCVLRSSDDFEIKPVTLTNVDIYFYERNNRLAYCIDGDGISECNLRFFLIGNDGEAEEIASINSSRASSTTFFVPQSVVTFSGAKTYGFGLYAFVTFASQDQTECRIYEASADLESWRQISESECFVPVIYMNGRGNKYEDTLNAVNSYVEKAEYLEEQNLLTGKFRAYFSSDGYSDSFQLPLTNLDSDPITCKLYLSSGVTTWNVPSGSKVTVSSSSGENLLLTCDRTKGLLSFKVNSSTAYAIPMYSKYNGNNLVVTASKKINGGFNAVVGCSQCTVHNSRIFLCKNTSFDNSVYCASLDKPLYFPKSSMVGLGNKSDPVNVMAVLSNKLIAFKTNQMYRLDVSFGNRFTGEQPLVEDRREIIVPDSIKVLPLNTNVGCDCASTMSLCSNHLVWLNFDGKVYSFSGNTGQNALTEISLPIESLLVKKLYESFTPAKAFSYSGKYFLIFDNSVIVLDSKIGKFGFSSDAPGKNYTIPHIAWYYWEFPENLYLSGGFNSQNGLMLLCNDSSGHIKYTALLNETEDNIISYQDSQTLTQIYPVNSSFSTKSFELCPIDKNVRINKVNFLYSSDKKVDLNISCEGPKKIRELSATKKLSSNTVIPFIRTCDTAKFSFSSNAPFGVAQILINYHEMG